MRPRSRAGFTLIELLVVVVILGILATIAMTRFWQVKEDSFISTMKADLRTVANNQEIYHSSNLVYTADLVALDFTPSSGVTLTVNEATGQGWAATAVHASMPAAQCGMFTGTADPAGADPATVPGVLACRE